MFTFRMFQQFAGLPDTGQLTRRTVAKMKERRCGVPDIVDNLDPNKPMEYTLNGKPNTTYKTCFKSASKIVREADQEIPQS